MNIWLTLPVLLGLGAPVSSQAAPLPVCSTESMADLDIKGVSWRDASQICEVLRRSVPGALTTQDLQSLIRAARVSSVVIPRQPEPNEVAPQLVEIAKLRGGSQRQGGIPATMESM